MKRSKERILTTHTGSLPRPEGVTDLLYENAAGLITDQAQYQEEIRQGVAVVAGKQADAGIDVINDGEAGKLSYFSYVAERLSGFGGEAKPSSYKAKDMADFPGFSSFAFSNSKDDKDTPKREIVRPACIGDISYVDEDAVEVDIANLKAGAEGRNVSDLFLSAASPGLICAFMQNHHYDSREDYLFAIAEAMRTEYELIAQSGLIVQLDCPDLAASYNSTKYSNGVGEFRRDIEVNIEALNHATKNIPEGQLRMHVCWGNYDGPHHHDVPLKDIVDIIMKARPMAVSFEGANARHEHEYNVWDDTKLPDGKVLMPGVLDSTSNCIEHPELICQRIVRYAERVGRENVIPGSDCGFGTGAGMGMVHTGIVWAKLESLAEGARLATEKLW